MQRADGRQSERRHATVLFADISGFTSLSEQVDPEVMTAAMNRCYRLLSPLVMDPGATIVQYQGDCIVALFGVPIAIENAARQAINAAIEIRNRVGELADQELPVELSVHMGLNSGLVIAGEVGGDFMHEFTAMGDVVNVASRLKDKSQRGQIFVPLDPLPPPKGEFEYRQLGPLPLKGKEHPVPVYELLSRQQQIHRPRMGAGSRTISSVMIGRDRELAEVAQRLDALLRGEGSILGII